MRGRSPVPKRRARPGFAIEGGLSFEPDHGSAFGERRRSLALDRILHATDDVLSLALGLIHYALVLELLVAGHLAGTLFQFAAHVCGGALHAIFVHDVAS